MTKKCSKCKIEKPAEDFRKRSDTKCGLDGPCRECRGVPTKRIVPDGYKWCPKCQTIKIHGLFNLSNSSKDGLQSWCKTCSGIKTRLWYHTPEGQKATKRNKLKRYSGMTIEEYDELSDLQKGLCAVCSTHVSECPKGTLYVDHDHITGKIRGLLCNTCNSGIGMLKDSPILLNKAISYLNLPPANSIFK